MKKTPDQKLDLVLSVVLDIKKDVTVLKKDVAVLKSDVDILKRDVATLKSDVTLLKSDVSLLKKDVTTLKETLPTLATKQELGEVLEIVTFIKDNAVERREFSNITKYMELQKNFFNHR